MNLLAYLMTVVWMGGVMFSVMHSTRNTKKPTRDDVLFALWWPIRLVMDFCFAVLFILHHACAWALLIVYVDIMNDDRFDKINSWLMKCDRWRT